MRGSRRYLARRDPKTLASIRHRGRDDDPGFAQLLYQLLEIEFGAANLFMDAEGHIKPGDDFVEVLSTQVAKCDMLLAVIGPSPSRRTAGTSSAAAQTIKVWEPGVQ